MRVTEDQQYLPVPLGSLRPLRGGPHRRRFRARLRWTHIELVIALVCAAGGVALAVSAAPASAERAGGGIVVDDVRLQPVSGSHTAFTGPISMVITRLPTGTVHAASVGYVNGLAATGRCVMSSVRQVLTERCAFTLGGMSLASTDTFDPKRAQWFRQYSDGVAVRITSDTAGDVVPVPLPLGR